MSKSKSVTWTRADVEKAKKALKEDDDIPRNDPSEDEPYMTKSEREAQGKGKQ